MQICQGCLTLLKFFFEPSRGVWGDDPPPQENFENLMSKIG